MIIKKAIESCVFKYRVDRKTIFSTAIFMFLLFIEIFASTFLTWNLDSLSFRYLNNCLNTKPGVVSFCFNASGSEELWNNYNKFGIQNASYLSQKECSIDDYDSEQICFIFTEKFQSDRLYNEFGVLSVNEQFGWDNLNQSSVFISQELSERVFGVKYISNFNDKYINIDGNSYKVGGLYYSNSSKTSSSLGDYYRNNYGETIFIKKDTLLDIPKEKICISFYKNNTNIKKSFNDAKNIYDFGDNEITYAQESVDRDIKKLNSYKKSIWRIIMYIIFVPVIIALLFVSYKILIPNIHISYEINAIAFAIVSILIPVVFILVFKNILLSLIPIYLVCESSIFIISINIILSLFFIYKNISKRTMSIGNEKYLDIYI